MVLINLNSSKLHRKRKKNSKNFINTTIHLSSKFWKTQPVPQFDAETQCEGIIEPNTPLDKVKQTPYSIPTSFEWCVLDITNKKECKEVYELLTQNYVEDDDALFRFNYSDEFLQW